MSLHLSDHVDAAKGHVPRPLNTFETAICEALEAGFILPAYVAADAWLTNETRAKHLDRATLNVLQTDLQADIALALGERKFGGIAMCDVVQNFIQKRVLEPTGK